MLKNVFYLLLCLVCATLVLGVAKTVSVMGILDTTDTSGPAIKWFPGNGTIGTVFVGDIMLDRGVAMSIKKYGSEHIFDGVEHVLKGADAVIGNFEGTMTTLPSIAVPGSDVLRFTFDPALAAVLKKAGFTALSLANNHSLDFGRDAYIETRNNLHGANILTFGSALNSENLSTVVPIGKIAMCLVGYHDLFVADPSSVLLEIETIRPNCTRITVVVHWGVEYTHAPNDRQRLLAKSFIDAGADLVMGMHPHVVQSIEMYNGKAIFYSLGNFVFDQNFSFETMHGLAVNVEWSNSRTRFELIPVAIAKGQVTVADGEAREKTIAFTIDEKTPLDVAESIRERGEFVVEND